MVEIKWTASALQELEDIGEYIAKDSIRYAEITVFELFSSVDILEHYPKAGAKVPEFNEESIRHLIVGNYRIVYHLASEFMIEILTVHNTARLLSNTKAFKDK